MTTPNLDLSLAACGVPAWCSSSGSVPLLSAAEAKAGDDAAIAAGEPPAALMDRAAGHLARHTVAYAGYGYGLKVAILVGKGNNGGDGWAAAALLRDTYGASCWVVAVDGTEVAVSDEAHAHRATWLATGGRTSVGTDRVDTALAWADVAIDALLGTGTRGAPRDQAAAAVAALERAEPRPIVVACDIPSGVSADDGAATGAVFADLTVTFGALKRGLVLHPGAVHAGQVVVGDLGEKYRPPATGWRSLTAHEAAPTRLATDADKRARGTVLVVAGAAGTSGAAVIASEGALRAGAGLVTAAVPQTVQAAVDARVDPGVMVQAVTVDSDGALSKAAVDELDALEQFGAVVVGPGLGYGKGTAKVVAHVRKNASRAVLDADALNVHRDKPARLADHRGQLVLTPHERELARIGGGDDGPDAWAQRVERVPALAERYNATIVAKGPGTIVAAPDGRVWVCPVRPNDRRRGVGVPALGAGGSGDALAGIIGAAIANADDVPRASAQAVFWHAAAGVRAGADRADRAHATDLLAALPATLGDLQSAR